MRRRLTQVAAALIAGLTVWLITTGVSAPAPARLSGAAYDTATSAAPLSAPSSTAAPSPSLLPSATPWPTATALIQAPPLTQAVVEPVEAQTSTPRPVYQPTPDGEVGRRSVVLPILTYHYVEPWPADAGQLRQGLTVRPEDFAAQMSYLAEHGYVTVSLYDLVDALATGRALPDKAVILTFDDGYAGLFDYALPVMQPLGQTATVFVITEFADQQRAEYLNWPELRFMHELGWSIEPHTKTHLGLEGLSYNRQLYEMLGSIETVAANIGDRPRFFNYPSGSYDDTTLALMPELQLWGGVTTQGGWYHSYADRYTLTRVRVTGFTDLDHFIELVEYGR